MTIEGAILARLKEVTAVTNIIGTGDNARIHAEHLPQKPVFDAIVLKFVSLVRVHASGADPGIVRARLQVDAWSEGYIGARDLGDAIRGDNAGSALNRWSGTKDTTVVDDVFLENELPLTETGVGSDDRLYRNSQDYMVHYKE